MLGHTEWIKNNHDPKFQTLIECEYHFERKQVPAALLPRAHGARSCTGALSICLCGSGRLLTHG